MGDGGAGAQACCSVAPHRTGRRGVSCEICMTCGARSARARRARPVCAYFGSSDRDLAVDHRVRAGQRFKPGWRTQESGIRVEEGAPSAGRCHGQRDCRVAMIPISHGGFRNALTYSSGNALRNLDVGLHALVCSHADRRACKQSSRRTCSARRRNASDDDACIPGNGGSCPCSTLCFPCGLFPSPALIVRTGLAPSFGRVIKLEDLETSQSTLFQGRGAADDSSRVSCSSRATPLDSTRPSFSGEPNNEHMPRSRGGRTR